MLKECSKCKSILPFWKFDKGDPRFNFGLHYYCRKCKNENLRNRRKIKKQTGKKMTYTDKDILKFMGFTKDEIDFDTDPDNTVKVTIALDNDDIINLNRINKAYGTKNDSLIRFIIRLWFNSNKDKLNIEG